MESQDPTLLDFDIVCSSLQEVERKLNRLFDIYYIGPLEIHTSGFKFIALRRLREIQQVFVDLCVDRIIYPAFIEMALIDETERLISRPPLNLADVSGVMGAISNFREVEVTVDMKILKAEVSLASCEHYNCMQCRKGRRFRF